MLRRVIKTEDCYAKWIYEFYSTGMKNFDSQVAIALAAKSEDAMESAGNLFEEFIELMQEEDFDDFESYFKLDNFVIEDFWPKSGMFAEISSQLFTEYEIGGIDWIWENDLCMDYCIKFPDSDIHSQIESFWLAKLHGQRRSMNVDQRILMQPSEG